MDGERYLKKRGTQFFLFGFGGAAYVLIELLWRKHSHWSMFVAGGLCFQLITTINNLLKRGVPLWKRCGIGAAIITLVEFTIGCVVNKGMRLNVWDYSKLPLNVFGQICLPFTIAWYFLSAPIVWIGDFLNKTIAETTLPQVAVGKK